MKYSGMWRITEMAMWDEDYLNMEVKAFIKIDSKGMGEFQFGLVSGQIDGEIVMDGVDERFEFTWDGNDECDPASGSGWLRLKGKNMMEGKLKLHLGDSSSLIAKRVRAN
jgi:hypothetical protein